MSHQQAVRSVGEDRQRIIEALKSFATDTHKSCDPILQPNYVLPMALATAQAVSVGYDRLSAVEFGVAHGRGLLALCEIARRLTAISGVSFDVFGFDTYSGMPTPKDYRDHPEIWASGQYATEDFAGLKSKLPDFCEMVIGDVSETTPKFVKDALSPRSPIGFVSIDLDYYSSTVSALEILKGPASRYLPAVLMYFDDIDGNITLNAWAGEELAINEFNDLPIARRIQRKVSNSPKMFCCHVLDHPVRTGEERCAIPINLPVSWFQRR